MLYIKNSKKKDGEPFWLPWHVGEPLPKMPARVVTFQADGDELEVVVKALKEWAQGEK